eukprot:m.313549 g.313549  ORF g.313549 m.313549 type:complete len:136 (+) comp403702_c0_seq1:168-575(+)
MDVTKPLFGKLLNRTNVTRLISRTGNSTLTCTESGPLLSISDFYSFAVENLTFVGCTLAFNSVKEVSIVESRFTNSFGRAVSIANVATVTIHGVTFESNPAMRSAGIQLKLGRTDEIDSGLPHVLRPLLFPSAVP